MGGVEDVARNVVPNQAITFNGQTLHIAEEMNLTEMHKASGMPRSYGPAEWARRHGKDFLQSMHANTAERRNLIRSVRGRTGGTFAHWQIGMEYARYLSPDLAKVCNQIVKDFVEAKPVIAVSVIDRTTAPDVLLILENRAKSKRVNLELNGEDG